MTARFLGVYDGASIADPLEPRVEGSPAGSCLAWAFTAPFLALILTPVSDGLGAACCVDIQQGNWSPRVRCLS